MIRSQEKYALFAVITVAICTFAFYIHRHRQGRTGYLDDMLISVTGGVQKRVFYFVRGTKSIVDHYFFLVGAQKENERLRNEVESLRQSLSKMNEVVLENTRFQKALQFQKDGSQKMLAAHVIAHDVSSDYFGVRIDRGSQDGVEIGMGVISPAGLVGRIQRVTPSYAYVRTLVDPNSNIDVVVQRSRARGVISGQSRKLNCRLRYVDRLEDVKVNDTVVSSGFGSVFPRGLLVGHVTSVIPDPNGVLQAVTVKTAVDIYRLEEVLIVFPEQKSKTVS